MAKLLFFDASHTYTLDGEEIPSVSELTRFISREIYSDVQQFNLDSAADRGSKIHKATEALDKFGSVEVDDSIAAYVKAYVSFLKTHDVQWQKIEWAVCSPENDYAGTLDRYGEVDGVHAIVDIKSTANITPAHRKLYEAGQNLYRKAIQAEYPVERLLILQLKSDGTYKLIELPIDDGLADACRLMHKALKKRKRKKKEKIPQDD